MNYKEGHYSENKGSNEKPAEEAKLPYLANVKAEQKSMDELGFNFNELSTEEGFLSKGFEEQMNMPNPSVVGTMPRHANLYEFTGYTSLDYDTIATQSAQIYSNYVGNQYNSYYTEEAPEAPQVAPGEYIVDDSYMASTSFSGAGNYNCYTKEKPNMDAGIDSGEYVPHRSRRSSRKSTGSTPVGGRKVAKKGKRSDAEDEARRHNHNEIERKRRENISNLLHRLNNLLPPLNKSNKGNYHAPSSKTAILTRACAYFEELNKRNMQEEQQMNQVEKPEEMGAIEAGAYFLDGKQRK